MRVALGVDAAWTDRNPSGVALAAEGEGGWRLVAAASSYADFFRQAFGGDLGSAFAPQPERLVAACRAIAGAPPDMIAVDMPLSRQPIVGRRASDRAVSRAFGARKCATHSPSALRPGGLSDRMRADFEALDYSLWTTAVATPPGLIEVYPHTALLALTGASERLEYKAGKTTTYWPGEAAAERKRRLFAVWARMVAALEREIDGVAEALRLPETSTVGRALKAYEDKLDAVVCAWSAIQALEGRCDALGDADSAVWIARAPNRASGGYK